MFFYFVAESVDKRGNRHETDILANEIENEMSHSPKSIISAAIKMRKLARGCDDYPMRCDGE